MIVRIGYSLASKAKRRRDHRTTGDHDLKIEEAGAEIRESGVLTEWFKGCDEKVKRVAEPVNGVLLSELLQKGGHADLECAEIFREGKFAILGARRALHSLFAQARRCMKN